MPRDRGALSAGKLHVAARPGARFADRRTGRGEPPHSPIRMLKNPYLVPGLERGLRLLQLFRRGRAELAAPEIARELDLPRTTAFRLLQTLEALEFVERNDAGAWRLG